MDRPKLFQVFPTENHCVDLFYDNGEIKLLDCTWILNKGGAFSRLHDMIAFKDLCTMMNGTLAWDISEKRDPGNCIDLCPDTVYERSVRIKADRTA